MVKYKIRLRIIGSVTKAIDFKFMKEHKPLHDAILLRVVLSTQAKRRFVTW